MFKTSKDIPKLEQETKIGETTVKLKSVLVNEGSYKTPSTWMCIITINDKSACFEYTQGAAYRYIAKPYPHGGALPKGFRVGHPVPYMHYTMYEINVLCACSEPMPPKISDVLESLSLDYSAGEMVSFEDFADTYGYDPDSRSAEAIYLACRANAKKVRTIGLHHLFDLMEVS